ncbi:S8 family serine peptidase [Tessaracoccus palaemonis]|uniref:S8 family serine peptidase n=1 Tax=Tessaracoccus palaemonis TaxID=2829499 RepID=A0ABX8SII3_9ACTN|nr:S8 family serine peptidase [Tessaracoccus palaemonis]QXT62689.1 S8 family serine peptidase [Tessaracoccus palaemonis]
MERASKWLALLSVGALLAGVAATPATAAPATEDYVVLTKKAGFSAQSGASIAQIQGQFERETRELTAAQAESLRREDGVLAVLPDITTSWIGSESLTAQASTSTVNSWGLDRIDQRSKSLDKKFNTTTFSGTNTIAVVIDSGVSPSTQFGGRLLQGYGWDYVDGDSDTTDCNGHGTHVAGTIASTGYGVATSASVLPLRVLDCEGNGSPESLYLALTDLLTWYQEQPQLAGRVVVNMSLGGYVSVVGEDVAAVIESAVADLVRAGMPVVVAAGNDGTSVANTTPARSTVPVVVGATTKTDARASFSNYGRSVDVFAPGEKIVSLYTEGRIATGSGTSMAAPHVTGTILRSLERKRASAATVVKRVLSEATTGTVTSLKGSAGRLVYVPVKPNTPTSVKATRSDSKHTVKLTWKAPTTVEGFSVTGYVVERAGKKVKLKSSARSYTWKSLKPGTKTTMSVRAVSARGTGAAKSVTATMLALPGKPKSVKATSGSKKDKSVSIIATWKKPTTGGGKISGYLVTAERKSDGKKKTITVSSSARKATFKGLKKGKGYVVTVKAKNAAGKGSSSKKSSKAIAR